MKEIIGTILVAGGAALKGRPNMVRVRDLDRQVHILLELLTSWLTADKILKLSELVYSSVKYRLS